MGLHQGRPLRSRFLAHGLEGLPGKAVELGGVGADAHAPEGFDQGAPRVLVGLLPVRAASDADHALEIERRGDGLLQALVASPGPQGIRLLHHGQQVFVKPLDHGTRPGIAGSGGKGRQQQGKEGQDFGDHEMAVHAFL